MDYYIEYRCETIDEIKLRTDQLCKCGRKSDGVGILYGVVREPMCIKHAMRGAEISDHFEWFGWEVTSHLVPELKKRSDASRAHNYLNRKRGRVNYETICQNK